MHDDTAVGPLTSVSAGHVVVVQPLPDFAADGVQEATATFVVLLVEQVVVVQLLPEAAVDPEQEATGTLVVTLVPQVVVVQLFPDDAALAEHDDTAVGPEVTMGHVVAV